MVLTQRTQVNTLPIWYIGIGMPAARTCRS